MTTRLAPSAPAVKSVITLPSPLNVASREPFVLYRARANLGLEPSIPAAPAATIFPSALMARSRPLSRFGVKSVVTLPSPPNVASREPLVLYRARANFALDPPNPATPAATIFPSAWMATSIAHSAFGVKLVVTLPSPLNVVSRSPGAADAGPATANDSATKAATKAARLGWTRLRSNRLARVKRGIPMTETPQGRRTSVSTHELERVKEAGAGRCARESLRAKHPVEDELVAYVLSNCQMLWTRYHAAAPSSVPSSLLSRS